MRVDRSTGPQAPPSDAESLLEVVREVARELDPSSPAPRMVHLDSRLDRDLGFDSLGRVELITRLEERFGVVLPERLLVAASVVTADELQKARSFGQNRGVPLEKAVVALELADEERVWNHISIISQMIPRLTTDITLLRSNRLSRGGQNR